MAMTISFSHCKPPISGYTLYQNPASISLNRSAASCAGKSTIPADLFAGRRRRRKMSIVAAIENDGAIGELGTPLEPTSSAGMSLCQVLLQDPYSFYDAVSEKLNDMAVDRDEAVDRMELSLGKPEACLHRRIAEMKEAEHFSILEDIIYMIIYKKFKDINVPLTQKVDKRLSYNNSDISPSNNYDLKSIHSHEIMEVIEEFLTAILGLKPESVSLDTALTDMLHLNKVYSNSVYYGYFLKSVFLRHRLEHYMSENKFHILPPVFQPFASGSGNIALEEFSSIRSTAMTRVQSPKPKLPLKLKSYVQGLDQTAIRVCKEMRSKVSLYVVQDHCLGLLSVEDLDSYEQFSVSLAKLERLVLEAVAFGCFLWDAEEYVDRVYNLRKNLKSTRVV